MARKRKMPAFEPYEQKRWQCSMNSIVATIQQVADGLLKLKTREDVNPTPINVAAILLMRLEDMRKDSAKRVELAISALEAGNKTRAEFELHAIRQTLAAQRNGTHHGVRVSTDLQYHADRLPA